MCLQRSCTSVAFRFGRVTDAGPGPGSYAGTTIPSARPVSPSATVAAAAMRTISPRTATVARTVPSNVSRRRYRKCVFVGQKWRLLLLLPGAVAADGKQSCLSLKQSCLLLSHLRTLVLRWRASSVCLLGCVGLLGFRRNHMRKTHYTRWRVDYNWGVVRYIGSGNLYRHPIFIDLIMLDGIMPLLVAHFGHPFHNNCRGFRLFHPLCVHQLIGVAIVTNVCPLPFCHALSLIPSLYACLPPHTHTQPMR